MFKGMINFFFHFLLTFSYVYVRPSFILLYPFFIKIREGFLTKVILLYVFNVIFYCYSKLCILNIALTFPGYFIDSFILNILSFCMSKLNFIKTMFGYNRQEVIIQLKLFFSISFSHPSCTYINS